MKKIFTGFVSVTVVLFLCIYVLINYHFPYCMNIVKKISGVYEQYRVAQDTAGLVIELKKKKEEIGRIDSLLQFQIFRESEVKRGIVEALYLFADSADLKASKVEVGERLPVDGRYETGISIQGTGSYFSAGKFIEHIENYPKSTRVRQAVLKNSGKKEVELFVDFVLME